VLLESLLKLSSLDVLLIFNLLLNVLVSLKELVVLCLSKLQSLVKVGFQLLFQSIHFVLLLLDELSFGSNDLLAALLKVAFTLYTLKLLAADLGLVSILILFLFSLSILDSLQVE